MLIHDCRRSRSRSADDACDPWFYAPQAGHRSCLAGSNLGQARHRDHLVWHAALSGLALPGRTRLAADAAQAARWIPTVRRLRHHCARRGSGIIGGKESADNIALCMGCKGAPEWSHRYSTMGKSLSWIVWNVEKMVGDPPGPFLTYPGYREEIAKAHHDQASCYTAELLEKLDHHTRARVEALMAGALVPWVPGTLSGAEANPAGQAISATSAGGSGQVGAADAAVIDRFGPPSPPGTVAPSRESVDLLHLQQIAMDALGKKKRRLFSVWCFIRGRFMSGDELSVKDVTYSNYNTPNPEYHRSTAGKAYAIEKASEYTNANYPYVCNCSRNDNLHNYDFSSNQTGSRVALCGELGKHICLKCEP